MSNIVTVRDIEMVTGEIKFVQRRAARQLLTDLIEIGRLLVEAKSMVPYGEWGKYLEERVEYSTSQANNLMRLYNEYGDNQESFFATLQNSQTFGKLSYTQALALIALPPEERAEFAEQHDVEHMSTRELERAIREELEEVRCGKNAAEQRVEKLEEELAEANRQTRAQQDAAQMARDAQMELNEALEKARKQAEKKEKEAEKARAQLESAQKNEKSVRQQLEQLQQNPKIPAAMMDQIRLEAEQEAARKSKVELEKQLKSLEEERSAAVKKAEKLEAELGAAQRAAKMSDPVITETVVRVQKLQNDFNELNGLRLKQLAAGTEDAVKTAGTMRKIMADMVEQMLRIVGA